MSHTNYTNHANYTSQTNALVGEPGFEPGITRSQSGHVSRYTIPRKSDQSPQEL